MQLDLLEIQTAPQTFDWRQMQNYNGRATIVSSQVLFKFILPENKQQNSIWCKQVMYRTTNISSSRW